MAAVDNNGLVSGTVQTVLVIGYMRNLNEETSSGIIYPQEPIQLSSDSIYQFSFNSLNSYPQYGTSGGR